MIVRQFCLSVIILVCVSNLAVAQLVTAVDVADQLKGNTYDGVNHKGSKFFIYHQSDGTFEGKFLNKTGGAKYGKGKYYANDDGEICWKWTSGWHVTDCYSKFELEGSSLELTRPKGRLITGNIVSGNPENF